MKNSLQKEKGAVSVLVAITVLTFMAVLLAAYVKVSTLQESQLKSDKRIQEIYGKDVLSADMLYLEFENNKNIVINSVNNVENVNNVDNVVNDINPDSNSTI